MATEIYSKEQIDVFVDELTIIIANMRNEISALQRRVNVLEGMNYLDGFA